MSGHLDGPPPGPPDPPYIPGDLGAPSAEEFARRRASPEPERNPYLAVSPHEIIQERADRLARCWDEGFAAGRAAATPDERLREALRDANEYLAQIADYSPSEVADAIDSVRAQIKDALAATDSRGKPDGASVPDQSCATCGGTGDRNGNRRAADPFGTCPGCGGTGNVAAADREAPDGDVKTKPIYTRCRCGATHRIWEDGDNPVEESKIRCLSCGANSGLIISQTPPAPDVPTPKETTPDA